MASPAQLLETSNPANDSLNQDIEGASNESENEKPTAEGQGEIPEPPFSIFTPAQKGWIVALASIAALASPMTGSIYYPALKVLADELQVSATKISLTITSYLIFQGITPAFIGSISDAKGRRPSYLICYVLYLGANIGLACQSNYVALFLLRCLQSAGSSSTIALASAVVADVVTTAERGTYMGYATVGALLGPAFSPVIGGILTEFLGWRSIFWFLAIYCGVLLLLFITLFPETCRSVVGNGSIPSQKWNVSLLTYLALKKAREAGIPAQPRLKASSSSQIGPMGAVRMLVDKESGIILMYSGLLFAGFYMVMAALPLQLGAEYGFNELQVGLCFIPLGIGSMLAALTVGKLADKNFARHAARLGIEISKSKQQNLANFPIERARLEVAAPLLAVAHLGVIAYGWVMQNQTSLAGPLILLFVFGFVVSGSMNVLGTLIVDLNRSSAATATAALNLTRCLLGAAGVAAMQPMLEAMGQGWTSVTLVGIWILCAPGMWLVWKYGPKWREDKRVKEEKKEAESKERERGSEALRDLEAVAE